MSHVQGIPCDPPGELRALSSSCRLAVTGLGAVGVATLMLACSGSKGKDTQGLWIANRTNVVEYTPSQLNSSSLFSNSTTSASTPHLALDSAFFGAPQGVTFDGSGNLWVVDPVANVNGVSTPALIEFSASDVAALGSNTAPDPVVVITSASLAYPQQAAFDSRGNLWVTDHVNNDVLVFTAEQLAVSGTNALIPAAIITSAALNGPLGIAFDSGGDLWIANNGGVTSSSGTTGAAGTTVVELSAASLPALSEGSQTVDLSPSVILSDNGSGSIQGPWALAFDSGGDLLVSNSSVSTVVEIPSGSLASSGAPSPSLTLLSSTVDGNPTIDAPNGVCLDNAGELAVVSSGGVFGLAFYGTPLPGGAAKPDNFLAPGVTSSGTGTSLDVPAGCVFGPDVE